VYAAMLRLHSLYLQAWHEQQGIRDQRAAAAAAADAANAGDAPAPAPAPAPAVVSRLPVGTLPELPPALSTEHPLTAGDLFPLLLPVAPHPTVLPTSFYDRSRAPDADADALVAHELRDWAATLSPPIRVALPRQHPDALPEDAPEDAPEAPAQAPLQAPPAQPRGPVPRSACPPRTRARPPPPGSLPAAPPARVIRGDSDTDLRGPPAAGRPATRARPASPAAPDAPREPAPGSRSRNPPGAASRQRRQR
jgi:hypothetical protein